MEGLASPIITEGAADAELIKTVKEISQ